MSQASTIHSFFHNIQFYLFHLSHFFTYLFYSYLILSSFRLFLSKMFLFFLPSFFQSLKRPHTHVHLFVSSANHFSVFMSSNFIITWQPFIRYMFYTFIIHSSVISSSTNSFIRPSVQIKSWIHLSLFVFVRHHLCMHSCNLFNYPSLNRSVHPSMLPICLTLSRFLSLPSAEVSVSKLTCCLM